jgi:hypothetical protein
MNTESMQALLRRQPFQPFEIRMSNGAAHQVRHPEMALLLRSNVILGSPDADDFIFCSLLHVAEVVALPAPPGGAGARENGNGR